LSKILSKKGSSHFGNKKNDSVYQLFAQNSVKNILAKKTVDLYIFPFLPDILLNFFAERPPRSQFLLGISPLKICLPQNLIKKFNEKRYEKSTPGFESLASCFPRIQR
jgi:hypothetical protein